MLLQFGNPFGIQHIGLPPRHRFNVLGIDHQHRKLAFQQVEDRLPVHARRFHRHVGAARLLQPIGQHQNISGHRAKGARLLLYPPVAIGNQQTRHDGLLMHIEPTAALIFDTHYDTSFC